MRTALKYRHFPTPVKSYTLQILLPFARSLGGKPLSSAQGKFMNTRFALQALLCVAFALVSTDGWGSVELESFGFGPGGSTHLLFNTVGSQTAPGPGSSPTAEAAWPVTMNYAWMDTLPASVEANFADRTHVALARTWSETRNGGWVWAGQGHGCFAILSRFGSVSRGTISTHRMPSRIRRGRRHSS